MLYNIWRKNCNLRNNAFLGLRTIKTRRIFFIPHIDDFVKDIMENGVSAKTPHEAEIKELTGVITAEKEKIEGEYEKIGRLYYKNNSHKTDGELGALVAGVNASKRKSRTASLRSVSCLISPSVRNAASRSTRTLSSATTAAQRCPSSSCRVWFSVSTATRL